MPLIKPDAHSCDREEKSGRRSVGQNSPRLCVISVYCSKAEENKQLSVFIDPASESVFSPTRSITPEVDGNQVQRVHYLCR